MRKESDTEGLAQGWNDAYLSEVLRERAMNQDEARKLDNKLMSMGLARLQDKEFLPQLGYLIQGDKHLGEMLRACAPDKRTEMYEALRPHLRFTPMPLDKYLMSGIILTDKLLTV